MEVSVPPAPEIGAVQHPDAPLIEAYLGWLASQRRAAALTLRAYRHDLLRLLDSLPERRLDSLNAQDFRRIIARLHAAGLGGRSLSRHLSAWRGLFRWLVQHHGWSVNPLDGLRAPRTARRLPSALSPDQAAQLLDADPEDALESRDHAMFELFYSSGLRLAELAAVELDGRLNLAEGEIEVTGKRSKTRIVPLGSKAIEAIRAWLPVRAGLAKTGESALFVNYRGRRLSVRGIALRLERWAQRQGLNVPVHPHMLRHSFASHLLQSSGDLRAVQELLGHTHLRSTQIYTHLDFQHLAKVYDAAHPRARKHKSD